MYETLFDYGIPIMIVFSMVNFFAALVLTAVTPPEGWDDKDIHGGYRKKYAMEKTGLKRTQPVFTRRTKSKIKRSA